MSYVVENHLGGRVVSQRLGFLLACGIGNVPQHDAVAERVWVGLRVDPQVLAALLVEYQRRYHQLRVEPAACLVDCLGDVVCGKARLEILLPLVRKTELGERHAPGIEPTVDDLRHAPIDTFLSRLGPSNLVDPRLVNHQVVRQRRIRGFGAVEVVERRRILGEDLIARRGHCHRSRHIVDPDVERGAPVAFARQRPVDVVAQEVAEPAGPDVLGKPVDFVVVREHLLVAGGSPDEPRRACVLDQRIFIGPPAERIVVAVVLTMDQ